MTYEGYIKEAKKTGSEYELPSYYRFIMDDQVLTPEEISSAIGVHTETVRRWCRDGKIRSESFGHYRIKGIELKKFLFEKDKRKFLKRGR